MLRVLIDKLRLRTPRMTIFGTVSQLRYVWKGDAPGNYIFAFEGRPQRYEFCAQTPEVFATLSQIRGGDRVRITVKACQNIDSGAPLEVLGALRVQESL